MWTENNQIPCLSTVRIARLYSFDTNRSVCKNFRTNDCKESSLIVISTFVQTVSVALIAYAISSKFEFHMATLSLIISDFMPRLYMVSLS